MMMTGYQFQSDVPKKGEPESHIKAVDKLRRVLKDDGWLPETDSTLRVVMNWTKSESVSHFRFFNDSYIHSYDISFVKEHENGLKSFLIVEVDGMGTRHEKQYQQNRDLTAEDYAKFALVETYRDLMKSIKEYDSNLHDFLMKQIAEKHLKFAMKDLYFLRIDKEDINDFYTDDELLATIKKKIKEHFK